MGRGFRFSVERDQYRFEGVIDENANLLALLPGISEMIVIDLGGVTRVTSIGAKRWIEFISRATAKARVILDRCSPVIVQQLYMVKTARGDARVRSLLLPYYCGSCERDETRLLPLDQGSTPSIARQAKCSFCGETMEFDDSPEMYQLVAQASSDDLLGITLDDRYQIMERIGTGGMSNVYRAIQTRCLGRSIALKVLRLAYTGDETIVKRFENEARVIAQLRHPSTVKMFDLGRTTAGHLYIVTELLIGETLDLRLRRGPLTPIETLRMLIHVSGSLAEAHGANIVHRDLKPANIFLEKIAGEDLAKVLDFGLVKLRDTPITVPFGVIGTPAYMSPEQANGQEIDCRSDVYSLGAIAYECLAGRPVFSGSTSISLAMKHVTEAPDPIGQVNPALSPDLCAFVMSMLEKDPAGRPANGAAVRQRVDELLLVARVGERAEHALDTGDITVVSPS